MKKKNGFTLVELIAVVAILVVILGMFVPTLLNSINENKTKALNKIYDLIETATRNYVMDYNIDLPNIIDLDDLCKTTYLECPITNIVTNEELDGYILVSEDYHYIEDTEISLSVEYNGAIPTQKFEPIYKTATIINLIEPTKEKSDFRGWEVVKGNSIIKEKQLIIGSTDTIVYAKWENWPKLTVDLSDGESIREFEDAYKSGTIIELVEPTKEGYKFMGWTVTSGNSILSGNKFTMGSEDTTLTANFTPLVIQGIYSESDNSLTFINDREYVVGETYNGNIVTAVFTGFATTASVPWGSYKDSIKKVEFIDEITPTSISGWFRDMNNCDKMDLTNLNTSQLTDMSQVFMNTGYNSTKFTLDLGDSFYTSNVNKMYSMFENTGYNSTEFILDLGNHFDTRKVKHMGEMFYCTGNKSTNFVLDLGDKFDTSNVENMSSMFVATGANSTELILDLGDHFNTSNVESMINMFNQAGVNSTKFTLDLGEHFNTSNVKNMDGMFSQTGRRSTNFTLNLGDNFNTSNVESMKNMFYYTGYSSTKFTLDLGDYFDTSKVTNMYSMFYNTGYSSTKFTLELGDYFDTSKVTNMSSMFNGTGFSSQVFTLDLGDYFDTTNVKEMQQMFAYTGNNSPVFTLNLGDNFNTSNVKQMSSMFYCTGNKSTVFTLDLGDYFDTSNVENMSHMFVATGATSPVFTLDLGNKFNTANVTNMSNMFNQAGASSTIFTLDLGDQFVFNESVNATLFGTKSGVSKLIIPESVTYIPAATFTNMRKLTEIVFEHSVGSTITLPAAGVETGVFYLSTFMDTTVTTTNDTIKNYDWASDKRTVTFN